MKGNIRWFGKAGLAELLLCSAKRRAWSQQVGEELRE